MRIVEKHNNVEHVSLLDVETDNEYNIKEPEYIKWKFNPETGKYEKKEIGGGIETLSHL